MIVTESAVVQKVSKANEYVLLYGESLKHSLQDEQMDAQAQAVGTCDILAPSSWDTLTIQSWVSN